MVPILIHERMITVPVMVPLPIFSKYAILKRTDLMKIKMILWMLRKWIYPYKRNISSRVWIKTYRKKNNIRRSR